MANEFERIKIRAHTLGFDNVWYDNYGTFVAANSFTDIEVRRDLRHGGNIVDVEISCHSFRYGISDNDLKNVKLFSKILSNAVILAKVLKDVRGV